MFQLAAEETGSLRSQSGAFKTGRGKHRKHAPYVFTEQGVVLNSDRAVQVNIEIMRAFVRLRESVFRHKDLAGKLTELENRYAASSRWSSTQFVVSNSVDGGCRGVHQGPRVLK